MSIKINIGLPFYSFFFYKSGKEMNTYVWVFSQQKTELGKPLKNTIFGHRPKTAKGFSSTAKHFIKVMCGHLRIRGGGLGRVSCKFICFKTNKLHHLHLQIAIDQNYVKYLFTCVQQNSSHFVFGQQSRKVSIIFKGPF